MVISSRFKKISFGLIAFFLVVLLSFLLIVFKGQLKSGLSNFVSVGRLTPKSSVLLKIEGNFLKVKFNILEKDKVQAESFLNSLEIDKRVFDEELSLELDEGSIEKIYSSLPNNLSLNFSGKRLEFSNVLLKKLDNGLSEKSFEFATGSGKIVLNTDGAQNLSLEILEPNALVKYATSSGDLLISKKMSELFPMLSKIATMKLNVSGKTISGEIEVR